MATTNQWQQNAVAANCDKKATTLKQLSGSGKEINNQELVEQTSNSNWWQQQ